MHLSLFLPANFSCLLHLAVFYRSLSDSKSPQLSKTLLSILANHNNAGWSGLFLFPIPPVFSGPLKVQLSQMVSPLPSSFWDFSIFWQNPNTCLSFCFFCFIFTQGQRNPPDDKCVCLFFSYCYCNYHYLSLFTNINTLIYQYLLIFCSHTHTHTHTHIYMRKRKIIWKNWLTCFAFGVASLESVHTVKHINLIFVVFLFLIGLDFILNQNYVCVCVCARVCVCVCVRARAYLNLF